ncbi:hypothetical protein PR048_030812 [Dryococelus australis]|uniref:Uncharacterized protein n=1 Tax=Dryococelus australis TaxID=614101 RepID=A0ABQ9G9Z2_9NEOP|nr:hypothetical protein PR048_030812 [Dryococelus australis]
MEQHRNARSGETEYPRENPLTSGIVRHDSHLRKSRVARPGIEPYSPWWELDTPLVDDRPIVKAVKYRVVSGVVWTNRTIMSSNTDTNRTDFLAVVDIVAIAGDGRHRMGKDKSAGLVGSRDVTLEQVAGKKPPEDPVRRSKIYTVHNLEQWIFCDPLRTLLHTIPKNRQVRRDNIAGGPRWCSGQTTARPGEPGSIPCGVAPRFSHVGIVPDDGAGRRVFSGISHFPRPCIPAVLLTHLISPSSALKTSVLRSAQMSPLHSTPRENVMRYLRLGYHTYTSHMSWSVLTVRARITKVQCQSYVILKVARSKADTTLAADRRMATAEPTWVIEISVEQRRNEMSRETGDLRDIPPTNAIARHDSHMRTSGVTRPGIEPLIALVGGEQANHPSHCGPL